jgi:hypothetical protein
MKNINYKTILASLIAFASISSTQIANAHTTSYQVEDALSSERQLVNQYFGDQYPIRIGYNMETDKLWMKPFFGPYAQTIESQTSPEKQENFEEKFSSIFYQADKGSRDEFKNAVKAFYEKAPLGSNVILISSNGNPYFAEVYEGKIATYGLASFISKYNEESQFIK